jgi:cell division protein DivIC
MLTRKRKKRKGFNFRRFFYILTFGVVFLFLLYSSINLLIKRQAFQKEINALLAEQEALLKKRESLKFSLGETYSETYLEKIAREDLNLKKPGERIYVIKKEGEPLQETESSEETAETFLDKLKSFFNW